MDKIPNCYKCKHRRNIPGNCHSKCNHPEVKTDSNSFGTLIELLAGNFTEVIKKLNIRGNPQGIRNGWFMWPANFDPAWLESCNGFEPIEGNNG